MIDLEEVNPPVNPCEDCMKNQAVSLAQSQGNLKFVYCVHNHAGGILLKRDTGHLWNIYSPIVLDEFTNVVTDLSTSFLHKQKMALRNKDLATKH